MNEDRQSSAYCFVPFPFPGFYVLCGDDTWNKLCPQGPFLVTWDTFFELRVCFRGGVGVTCMCIILCCSRILVVCLMQEVACFVGMLHLSLGLRG